MEIPKEILHVNTLLLQISGPLQTEGLEHIEMDWIEGLGQIEVDWIEDLGHIEMDWIEGLGQIEVDWIEGLGHIKNGMNWRPI